MTNIRADGYTLKDPDDDAAFQMLIGDVQRIKQELRMGSSSGAGGAPTGGVAFSGGLLAVNNLSDLNNAVTALANLGIGSIGTQNANNVTITGGSITGITDLAVADGGTAKSTISADAILYGSSSGVYSETTLSTFGRTLIDDASAPNARTTLGLGTIATQAASSVTITGGTAVLSSLIQGVAGSTESVLTAGSVDLYNSAGTSVVTASTAALSVRANDSNTILYVPVTTNIGLSEIRLLALSVKVSDTGGAVGFYGNAAVTKRTVTGSRGANAALASLLTALSSIGLLTDSSTA